LFRGVSAVAAGAAPAHAMHFATYEFCKRLFGGSTTGEHGGHHPIATGAAGICATLVSDAILTPMDAVKQRMQLGTYKGIFECVRGVVSAQGFRGLYAGYTTTLSMSVPYNAFYFASYESFRRLLKRGTEREFDVVAHFVAGGLAGSFAAAITTPFDVAKTRLQTQTLHTSTINGEQQTAILKYRGVVNTLQTIWAEEGRAGLLRGLKPRILLHSTSAAICWVTYEWMKHFLQRVGIA